MSPEGSDLNKFEDIKSLFHRAEDRIKRVESNDKDSGVVVPAINELRYAGFHLLEASTADNDEDCSEQLQRAKRHCQRAVYDAVEVAALDRLDRFDMFDQDYRLVSFGEIIPDYTDKKRYVREVREFINETSREEREQKYQQCEEYLDNLDSIVNQLDDARPDINKITRRWRIGIFLTSIGIFISLIALIQAFVLS